MPARVATDKRQNRWRLAEAAYSEAMLSELKKRFGFDAPQPEFAQELRDMASRYILSRRGEDTQAEERHDWFQALGKASRDEFIAAILTGHAGHPVWLQPRAVKSPPQPKNRARAGHRQSQA